MELIKIPNRQIMYKSYLDGEITETEYKIYLAKQEKRERQTSEKFARFVKGVIIYETIL